MLEEENNSSKFMSESINELAAALSQFQGAAVQPSFNKAVNYGQTRFRYADLAECQRVTRKPLADAGLAVTQTIEGRYLVTRLMHKSGQFISSQLPMSAPSKMQELGSMLTYLKRYAYCAILGIAADDDDDANLCDNTGKVAENIEKPAPTPRPTDKPAPTPRPTDKQVRSAKTNTESKIADAVMDKAYDDDIAQAIALTIAAQSVDDLQGIWDSVTDAMRADKRFIGAVKTKKAELNGTNR